MGFNIVNPTRGIHRANRGENLLRFNATKRNSILLFHLFVPLPNHVRGGQIANLLKADCQYIRHRLLVVVAHKTCKSQGQATSLSRTQSSHTDRWNASRCLMLCSNILRSVEYPSIQNRRIFIVQRSILISVDIPRANGDAKFLLLRKLLSNAIEFAQNDSVGYERNIRSDLSSSSVGNHLPMTYGVRRAATDRSCK